MSETPTHSVRRWLWIGLSILVLAAVVVVLFQSEDTVDVSRISQPAPAPIVTVLTVDKDRTAAQVEVFAELRPRWSAEIRAAVSGRILKVNDAALAGTRVAAETPLFEIEQAQYATAVAAAEVGLQEAELALLRAQNNATVARRQFDRNGDKPPNELALRLPELRIAERTVASAEAQLNAARQQLEDTKVVAPFSGFVTERMASLGQTVSAGEPLLALSDDRQFELIAELSQRDWALLQHPIAGGHAMLLHRDGKPLGKADIRQGGGFLDPKTRQIRVFLEVNDPTFDALSGDFLRVVFSGKPMEQTVTIPETSLTRAGYIWLVDGEGLLIRHKPDILFRAGRRVTIHPPEGSGPWQVARTPLASFLPGQKVDPQVMED